MKPATGSLKECTSLANIYTVARTVVYYYEIAAESEQQALAEVGQMPLSSAVDVQPITQDVVNVEETV